MTVKSTSLKVKRPKLSNIIKKYSWFEFWMFFKFKTLKLDWAILRLSIQYSNSILLPS